MIASDDASVASKDKIDRQNEWRKKMKEDAKRSAQDQLRDWMASIVKLCHAQDKDHGCVEKSNRTSIQPLQLLLGASVVYEQEF